MGGDAPAPRLRRSPSRGLTRLRRSGDHFRRCFTACRGRTTSEVGGTWGLGGGAYAAVLRQLGEQLVCLLRPLRVVVLDLLDELAYVVVVLRVLQELVVYLRALEGVVLDRHEVVDDVGGTLAHDCPLLQIEGESVTTGHTRHVWARTLRWGDERADLA